MIEPRPSSARQRHRDHRGAEVDQAAGEPGRRVFHQPACRRRAPGGAVAWRARSQAGHRARSSSDLGPVGIAGAAGPRRPRTCAATLVVARAVRAVQHQRRQEAHAAQRRGLLVGRQEGVEEVAVVALRAGSDASAPPVVATSHRSLPCSARAARAIGPAVGEHLVEPQLEQRRHRYHWIGCSSTTRVPARAAPARRPRRCRSRDSGHTGRAPAPPRRLAPRRAAAG